MRTELGKIINVYFGKGGYQDAQLGIHFTLGNDGWGVGDSRGAWDYELIKHSEYSKWTEEDRSKQYVEIMQYVSKLLKDAKVDTVARLKGTPVEVKFDGNTLKEWRILTEVI